ncbi:hypothetical protein HYH03_015021 [Edaphochlamys debaryana]|uniref:Uncharacterized protein n=1 Tax=Edaphochlamys debaryana TaxID=47281 RepID=A0A835XKA7_9CHLO|nr:hypothetical protein HYH03_015021 [Edaphochlamys debaryana]|eukprot:KAG2486317.1 hypothetical protein HYH03_015021 [Edaphochlamys debaryana]
MVADSILSPFSPCEQHTVVANICAPSASSRFSDDCSSSGSDCHLDAWQSSSDASEGTVRRGRPVRAALALLQSSCEASATMTASASLPVAATQAPIALSDLCTALSSPPSLASLAASHAAADKQRSRGADAAARAADAAALAVATAAATAAFARSMAWTAPEADVSSACDLPQPSACIARPSCETIAAAADCGFTAADAVMPCVPTSTRRGLYEGTCRGGVPRNLWQSVAVQAA